MEGDNRRKAKPCLTSFALQNSHVLPSMRVFGENSVSRTSRCDGCRPKTLLLLTEQTQSSQCSTNDENTSEGSDCILSVAVKPSETSDSVLLVAVDVSEVSDTILLVAVKPSEASDCALLVPVEPSEASDSTLSVAVKPAETSDGILLNAVKPSEISDSTLLNAVKPAEASDGILLITDREFFAPNLYLSSSERLSIAILRGLGGKITRVFAVFGSEAYKNASSASKQKLDNERERMAQTQVCVKKDAQRDISSTLHVLLCENCIFSKLPRSSYPPHTYRRFIAH